VEEYTNIQSLVSLSDEEVKSYSKSRKSSYEGIVPKFNDIRPEFLRICFFTASYHGDWNKETRKFEFPRCRVFDNLWNWDDLQTLHVIIGNPVATAFFEDKSPGLYFESFKNLKISDLIRLSKAFTISFTDGSRRPYKNWKEENPDILSWEIANFVESKIYQRTPNLNINEITDSLPQFILESPDLYIQLFNDSGCYKIPTVWTDSDWGHERNQEKLQEWRDYIGCPITKIPDENRYHVNITTPQQFLRLIKSYNFIHRYNPQTDVVSLIYTRVTDIPMGISTYVGMKIKI